jgi:molybdopterin-containing oxidoreductase family membrane subunit
MIDFRRVSDNALATTKDAGKSAFASIKDAGRTFHIILAILLALMAWGGFSWIRIMFIEGVGITGSSDLVPWGLYIVGFVFFVGTSAGASLMGLMIHGFGRKDYEPLGTRAILVGFLSLLAAVLFLMSDVGNPIRAGLLPVVLRNPTSMLVYTSMTYAGFAALMLSELFFAVKITLRGGKGSHWDEKMAKMLAIGALLFALMVVHAPHGALFAFLKAREMWNTPLLPAHFVTVALASGIAVMIHITISTTRITKKQIVSRETLSHMGGLLAFFLGVTLFMDFFDYLVMGYSGKPHGLETWHLLTSRFFPFFLTNTLGMFIAMAILLFKWGRTTTGLFMASTITIIAILAYRWNLIIVAQIPPLFPGTGEIYYVPTLPEWAVLLGIISLITFLYLVLTRVLPMEQTYQGN